MSCLNPLLAEHLPNGEVHVYGDYVKYLNLFKKERVRRFFMLLPCGKCFNCLLKRARDWCNRCEHELMEHEESCFITLTYNDEHLPFGGSLFKPDYQNFFKRLRKEIAPKKLRYFGCGEYGSENLRPHYHFIIFGWCPDDLRPWSYSGKAPLYRSDLLDSLWSIDGNPIGFCSVGGVSSDSIKYVCRYSMKKIQQDTSCKEVAPFVVMSNRPGIGEKWIKKYWKDICKFDKNGYIKEYGITYPTSNGLRTAAPPRYYTKKITDAGYAEGLRDYLVNSVRLNVPPPTLGNLNRERRFAKYRQRFLDADNAHYGLNDEVIVPIPPDTELDDENPSDCL